MSTLPSTDDLRRALLSHADTFCNLKETSRSAIGLEIANDPYMLFRIEQGQNITFKTYEKIRRWLDRRWPRQ